MTGQLFLNNGTQNAAALPMHFNENQLTRTAQSLTSNARRDKFISKIKRRATLTQLNMSPCKKIARQSTPQAFLRGQSNTTPVMLSATAKTKTQAKHTPKLTSTQRLQQDIRAKQKRTGLIPFQVNSNFYSNMSCKLHVAVIHIYVLHLSNCSFSNDYLPSARGFPKTTATLLCEHLMSTPMKSSKSSFVSPGSSNLS